MMHHALSFLLVRSLKNRIMLRAAMLRRPGYVLSLLAGAAYVYVLFFHHLFFGTPPAVLSSHDLPAAVQQLPEAGLALLLFSALALNAAFLRAPAPFFTNAETHFLFTAPVSRRSLIHYRLVKAQTGIVPATLISVIILARFQFFGHAVFLTVTVWLIYNLLFLCRTVCAASAAGKMLRIGIPGVCAAAVVSAAVRVNCSSPPAESSVNLLEVAAQAVLSGPPWYLLYPFRLMVRPVFAENFPDFILLVMPLLAVVLLFYATVMRSGRLFEKAVIGSVAQKIIGDAAGSRRHRSRGGRYRPVPFQLSPSGSGPFALYWKNMMMMGVFGDRKVLAAIPLTAIMIAVIAPHAGEGIAMATGAVAAALLFFLMFFGPVVFREDLRVDLNKADLLKTYPLPGWGVVLGETLAPVTVLAFLEVAMILPAAVLLPAAEGMTWSVSGRMAVGFGAVLVVPCLSCIGVLMQNAAAVLLPGWVHLGKASPQGVEAMGQRLIASIATIAALIIAAAPAAVIFLLIFFAGYGAAGPAIIPAAAAAAALFLLIEAGAGIVWLGKRFEKLDLSLHRQHFG